MYLKTLGKLVEPSDTGQVDFSPQQLAYLVQYPETLTDPQYDTILEKVLLAVPEDKRMQLWGKTLITATIEGHTACTEKVIELIKATGNSEMLVDILSGSESDVFEASASGKTESLIRLATLYAKYWNFQENSNRTFASHLWLAAQGGHDETVEKLVPVLAKLFPPDEFKHELQFAFDEAAPAGRISTIHKLLEVTSRLPNGKELIHEMLRRNFGGLLGESTVYEEFSPTNIKDGDDSPIIYDNSEAILKLIEEASVYGGTQLVRQMLDTDKLYERIGILLLTDKSNLPYDDTGVVTRLFEEARKYGDPELLHDMLKSSGMQQAFTKACEHGRITGPLLVLNEARELEKSSQLNSSSIVGDLISHDNFAPIRLAAANKKWDTAFALLAETPDFLQQQATTVLFQSYNSDLPIDGLKKHELWQELGGGKHHWKAVTNKEPPHESLNDYSPYKFKPLLYNELLPITQKACAIENNQGAEINAYKLAVLFGSLDEADRYITRYAEKWSGKETTQLIHDACLFELPKKGIWDVNRWKDFVLQHGPAVSKYLDHAPMVEKFLNKSGRPFPKTPQELSTIVKTIISYKRGHERPDLAELAAEYGLTEERFDKALDVLRASKTKDNLPEIFLDGADFGYPNYYMSKLDVSDLKGLILGEITNNCQSIGKQGEDSAVHGMTSENGGFYVWKRKANGRITDNDNIVAESWAWLSKDGTLVFDSFERLDSIYNKIAQPFLEQFTHQVLKEAPHAYVTTDETGKEQQHTIKAVHLGTGGATPPNIHLPRATPLSEPIDYTGYRDSSPTAQSPTMGQFIITPIDHKLMPDKTLPPPADDRLVELAARNYIRRTLKKFEERYGIKVRAGIELEFYAVGKDGKPTSEVLDLEKIRNDITDSPFIERIDHENTQDYQGQYEAVIGINATAGKELSKRHGDPMRAAMGAEVVRKHLMAQAKEYGLDSVNFDPLPFEEQEASGAHISISLWDTNGKPLFECNNNNVSPLLGATIQGMLETQRSTALLYAQNDKAYSRFGNTEWSPNIIAVSGSGRSGHSLRVANTNDHAFLLPASDPKDVRIENRLPSSDANYIVAMAGTIAGIDHALEKYVEVMPQDQKQTNATNQDAVKVGDKVFAVTKPAQDFGRYMLPTNRFDAAEAFKSGIKEDGLSDTLGQEFSAALLKQHHLEPQRLERA